MSGTDELLTIAEISVTLAGFAAVVAAFLHRGELHRIDRIRFMNLFAISFEALLLAFVPIALGHLGFVGTRLWAWSSGAMIVSWVLHMIFAPFVIGRIREDIPQFFSPAAALLIVPAFVNLLVQVLNLAGWPYESGFVPYLFGLLVYLYSAGISFVYTVVFRPSDSDLDG